MLGSLSNDHDEMAKKRLESFSKTATLQDQDVTMPNKASCLTPQPPPPPPGTDPLEFNSRKIYQYLTN